MKSSTFFRLSSSITYRSSHYYKPSCHLPQKSPLYTLGKKLILQDRQRRSSYHIAEQTRSYSNERRRREPTFHVIEVAQEILGNKRQHVPATANVTISLSDISLETPHNHKINEVQELIKHHAYRRIQLFYSQLLFYYDMRCTIEIDRTKLQHGKSSCPCCSAAHSAILPGVVDSKKLMQPTLQIYHNNNSTVCLPEGVNRFDCVIEHLMRPFSVELLNRVSNERLHPYEALKLFVYKMYDFFEKSRKQTQKKIEYLQRMSLIEKKIQALESVKNKKQTAWIKNYIRSVVQLKQLQRKYHDAKGFSLSSKLSPYPETRKRLFGMIFSYCPDPGQIEGWLKNQGVNPILNETILGSFKSLASLDPSIYKKQIKKLEESENILELTAEGTFLPDYLLLSGKKVRKKIRPMTEKDLKIIQDQLQSDHIERL